MRAAIRRRWQGLWRNRARERPRAEEQRDHGRDEAEDDRPVPLSPKERQVDFETREEHQHELAQVRQELRYRAAVPEDPQDMRADHDAAQQQTDHGGEARPTRQRWNDENEPHTHRELRERRQG